MSGDTYGKPKYQRLVPRVRDVIREYAGMRLTLRQIYYRLVAAQVIPNTVSQYKGLSAVLVDARMHGDIDFWAIEDRTRAMDVNSGSDQPAALYFNLWWRAIEDLARRYHMPRWWRQPIYVQVWVEKEALSRIFGDVVMREEVDLAVCRGYPSLTFLKEAADQLKTGRQRDGIERSWDDVHVLYFGDYDPSGLDIERYVEERLADLGAYPTVHRVALTRGQVDEYQIPPAPAKTTDSRYSQMEADEGEAMQVELDAIEPRQLQSMIRDAVSPYFDESIGDERDAELEDRRGRIQDWVDEALDTDFEPPGEDE